MASSSLAKRKRFDTTDGDSSIAQKHPSLWMSDGTIVLSAKSTLRDECRILFKVHKSNLAMHSSVFRDMFELPDTPEGMAVQDSFEGTPLVEVQDSAEDWAELLHLLYGNLSGISFKKYDPELEMSLMGVMRLVKKYDIDTLRATLVSKVQAQWPLTLKELDLYGDYVKRVTERLPARPDGKCLEPASAIRFANERDIPHILPVAFYLLSCISIKADWDVRREEENERYSARGVYPSARWRLLTSSDYARLMRGREELDSTARDYLYNISTQTCHRSKCIQVTKETSSSAYEAYFNAGNRRDILRMLEVHLTVGKWESLCRGCRIDQTRLARKTRADIWHRLPQMFGLENPSAWDTPEPNLFDYMIHDIEYEGEDIFDHDDDLDDVDALDPLDDL